MSTYTIFNPKAKGPLHELSKKEATNAFNWFMENRESRFAMLVEHASDLGFDLSGNNKDSLERLHELFVSEIRREGIVQTPSPYIFSLCLDIGIYVSEILIQDSGVLKWKIENGKRNVFFQRPVLFGFNVRNKSYCVDIDYLLCQYAFRLCRGGEKEPEKLLEMYESCLGKT